MLSRIFIALILCSIIACNGQAQHQHFDRQDTLRGSITPERVWWDLTYYHLDIEVDPEERTLKGKNTVQYRVLESAVRMQIDLQEPMEISRVTQNGRNLPVVRDGNVYYIDMISPPVKGNVDEIVIHYEGKPKISRRPPWDGGFTWKTDENGKTFAATSCQGDGASLWWPCKDHMYDEVDSMLISVKVPKDLMDVSNGRLRGIDEHKDGSRTFHWFVDNPINNYGVNVNIADYAHFSETYEGESGQLDCDYYVLKENLAKAKEQFKQVPLMLKAFEHWFGPYPFYEDGFKLVEVPYLGMEHQSSVTYGNQYTNGYLGSDLSQSGWGLKFDFIIIHEAGHEWFANNVTNKDVADMWIHEGFTAYSENLYLDYHYGTEAASAYVRGTRFNIANDRSVVSPNRDVNHPGSSDMYYKGANLLHTIRQIVNDDEHWRDVLRGINRDFRHQTVTSKQIESYMSQQLGKDFSSVFDQYLRDTRIPVFEYRFMKGRLAYRWGNVMQGFEMPIDVTLGSKEHRLKPNTGWQFLNLKSNEAELSVDEDYYVGELDMTVK